MPSLIQAFRALRPGKNTADRVIAPPYDVVSSAEARKLVAGRPDSFLRISRPEIEFPEGTAADSGPVYARGAENLARLEHEHVLQRDQQASFYVYRMRLDEHVQTGLALTASVAAYEQGRVRKHELTKPDKELGRVRNIESLNAQTGPVLCAYRAKAEIAELLGACTDVPPLFSASDANRVEHSIWQVREPATVKALVAAFEKLDALYIADGHHRSAAAARVAAARRAPDQAADASSEYFLSVAFPHDQLRILDYNRVVKDLNGLGVPALLAEVAQAFELEPMAAGHAPTAKGEFAMYLDGHWYRLVLQASERPRDLVLGLDVSVLQQRLLEPLLGIGDPRTDPRIDFVGGIRGLKELERRVDSGRDAVAFALHPTSMDELMAVADAGQLMPPKSTWFEPKLADGLLSHVLD